MKKIITLLSFVLIFVALITFNSCKKQPFVAPTGAILVISSEYPKIDFNGSTKVFVSGYAEDGTVLWDGTHVYFTVKNGTLKDKDGNTLEENAIELEGGYGEILAYGNQEMGTMEITARSGAVTAEPAPLEITVGRIQDVSLINLSVDPEYLPLGGDWATITASIMDQNNLPIPGVNVSFSTDKGDLESNGQYKTTNSNGVVTDRLFTSEEATVTVTCGEQSSTITVRVLGESNKPKADFEFSPTNPTSSDTVWFNAYNSYDPDGTIQSWSWDFGDQSAQGWGSRVSHQFNLGDEDSKTFNVTLTVHDDDNLSNSTSKNVQVSSDEELQASPVLVENIEATGTDPANPIIINVWNSKSSAIISFTITKEPAGMFDNLTPDTGSTPGTIEVHITSNAGALSDRYGSITLTYGTSKVVVINFHQLN